MNVIVGDRIVVESERVARPPRRGVVEKILRDTPPRYQVRWDDGRETIFAPASGAARVHLGLGLGEHGGIQDLFRLVNERIWELEAPNGRLHDFICECEDDTCTQVMTLDEPEYELVRAEPRQFAVLPGHEGSSIGSVVLRTDRFVVVQQRAA